MMSPTRVASHATDRKPKSVSIKVECCARCLSSRFVASCCGLPAQATAIAKSNDGACLPHACVTPTSASIGEDGDGVDLDQILGRGHLADLDHGRRRRG